MAVTFSYLPTGAGWATASLGIGEESVTVRVSRMTPRAPEDLLDALLALFYGARISWASWWDEPDIYRWRFTYMDERVHVTVIDSDSDDPWWEDECSVRMGFASEISLAELATAVVVGFENMLRGYSEKKYRRDWDKDGLTGLRERVEELAAVLVEGPKPTVPARLYRNGDTAQNRLWASDLLRRRHDEHAEIAAITRNYIRDREDDRLSGRTGPLAADAFLVVVEFGHYKRLPEAWRLEQRHPDASVADREAALAAAHVVTNDAYELTAEAWPEARLDIDAEIDWDEVDRVGAVALVSLKGRYPHLDEDALRRAVGQANSSHHRRCRS